MFNASELNLIDWMLTTAVENNPGDADLSALAQKVSDLIADGVDRLSR